MTNLKKQVITSSTKLADAWVAIQRVQGSALPLRCYENWEKRASLHESLLATVDLFTARNEAWNSVRLVDQSRNTGDVAQNRILYGSRWIDFSVARHLSLTSYIAVTWSIYDRLANVSGRLAGTSEIADQPKKNPKVSEHFLDDKQSLGFGTPQQIQYAYSWPIRISYQLRNWLVHSGYDIGSVPLFRSDRIADGFLLHDEAVMNLEKWGKYKHDNGKIETCCLSAIDEEWPTRDILKILEKYHIEIDMMFESLVEWSVESFVGQVKAFTKRDRIP